VETEVCCLCLDQLGRNAMFVAPCRHAWHYNCILPLLSSPQSFKCPVCRTSSDI
ncbi:hypothetical protein BC567DRAFT_142431, partial [Phyllosticta citribraziliensis]